MHVESPSGEGGTTIPAPWDGGIAEREGLAHRSH